MCCRVLAFKTRDAHNKNRDKYECICVFVRCCSATPTPAMCVSCSVLVCRRCTVHLERLSCRTCFEVCAQCHGVLSHKFDPTLAAAAATAAAAVYNSVHDAPSSSAYDLCAACRCSWPRRMMPVDDDDDGKAITVPNSSTILMCDFPPAAERVRHDSYVLGICKRFLCACDARGPRRQALIRWIIALLQVVCELTLLECSG